MHAQWLIIGAGANQFRYWVTEGASLSGSIPWVSSSVSSKTFLGVLYQQCDIFLSRGSYLCSKLVSYNICL